MVDFAITAFGTGAVAMMLISYALESRSRWFVALFAVGCGLSAIYALLVEAYPFLAVEAVWAGVAWRRFSTRSRRESAGKAPRL